MVVPDDGARRIGVGARTAAELHREQDGRVSTDQEIPAVPVEARGKPSQRQRNVEVIVFLSLLVPPMVQALFGLRPRIESTSFPVIATLVIFRNLAWVALVLYFVWRNDEGIRLLGWTGRNGLRDAALGVLLFPFVFMGVGLVGALLIKLGLSGTPRAIRSVLSIHTLWQVPLALVLVTVVAVTEETIFRGYLLLRFTAMTRSSCIAVLASTLVFAAGHSYEGAAGLVAVSLLGLIFSIVYLRTGSLVAPMVLHFLQDFMGIVLVPLLIPAK